MQRAQKKGRKDPLNHLQQKEEYLHYLLKNQEALDKIRSQWKDHQDKVVYLARETKAQDEEVSLFNGKKIRDKVALHANRIEIHLSQGAFRVFQEKQKSQRQTPAPLKEI